MPSKAMSVRSGPRFEGITATLVWSGVATLVILIVVNILVGVRVSQAVEVEGLDINLHGEVVPVEIIAQYHTREKRQQS